MLNGLAGNAASAPQVTSRLSPGRKKPKNRPLSAKMTNHTTAYARNGNGPWLNVFIDTITIMHDNIASRPYGLMFYSGTNANFTFNNWTNQIDIEPGVTGVTGDASNGYFAKGMPTGTTGITYNTLSATKLLDAGPRP